MPFTRLHFNPIPSSALFSTVAALAVLGSLSAAAHADAFTAGDLVISVSGRGAVGDTTTYTDNQASPLTLDEVTTGGSLVQKITLPQTSSGGNNAISAEYGSSSEDLLTLSPNGQYLTIGGYGVNAVQYNTNPAAFGGTTNNGALAQTTSLTSAPAYTSRVVALINGSGAVDTSTALVNVYDQNNIRSVVTTDGTHFYTSGQGAKLASSTADNTGGVFYAAKGASTATAITGDDGGASGNKDTRFISVQNNTLYAAQDTSIGSPNTGGILQLGTAGVLPNSLAKEAYVTGGALGGSGPGHQLASLGPPGENGVNNKRAGGTLDLSPTAYFFADSSTLYVTDSGSPKAGSPEKAGLGDGGLQKWSLVNGAWQLDYTLYQGLNLVDNSGTSGTTGLESLTAEVVNGMVDLFATNYTIGDLDQTYLYEITDNLSYTTVAQAASESFNILVTADTDTNIKGVAFAPAADVPEPATFAVFGIGLLGVGLVVRRARNS